MSKHRLPEVSKLVAVAMLMAMNAAKLWAGGPVPAKSMTDSIRFFGRWDLNTPRHALAVNSGSYLLARFSGPALEAHFDTALNKSPYPTIAWRIDDGEWQEAELWPRKKLAEGLPAGAHTVMLMVRGIDEHQSRWKAPLTGSITFTGFQVEGGALLPPLPEWDHPKLKLEFLGDSITEGVLVQGLREGKTTWAWQSDALNSYSCRTALQLGAAWRQVGFGATGLAHGGSGGAASALDSFNFFHDGCPRDDWQPDVVVLNQGSNDATAAPEKYQPLYFKYLVLIRQAYPQAKIAALRPFGGAQADSIKQAVAQVQAAGDALVFFIDTAGWHTGGLHPNAKESVNITDRLVEALRTQVIGSAAR